jgi:hypothetical protein
MFTRQTHWCLLTPCPPPPQVWDVLMAAFGADATAKLAPFGLKLTA